MSKTLNFKHVLVCEDIRPEMGGKSTILGLFGFSPDVKIEMPVLGPLPRLAFLLVATPLPVEVREVQFEIAFGPRGAQLVFHKMDAMTAEPTKAIHLMIQLANPPLPHFGYYALVVKTEGAVVATAEFEVRQAAKKPPMVIQG